MEWFCLRSGVQRTAYLPRLACRFKVLLYNIVPIVPRSSERRRLRRVRNVAWRHGKARQGKAARRMGGKRREAEFLELVRDNRRKRDRNRA